MAKSKEAFGEDEDVVEGKKKKEKKPKKEKKKKNEGKEGSKDHNEEDEEQEVKGSKLVVFIFTIIILAIWLGIIALLIKWDVGGFGSSVLAPVLKNVPYINKILPDTKVITSEPESEYSSLEQAVAKIKELEKQIEQSKTATKEDADTIKKLKEEIQRLSSYEQSAADLEKDKKEFYNEVVFSDKSPDIKEYQKFYESIDPAYAEEIYKQVITKVEADAKIKEYASTYSSMKPKQAATIMEQMTDNLQLVANILQNMTAAQRGSILGSMDSKVAASVTKLMEP